MNASLRKRASGVALALVALAAVASVHAAGTRVVARVGDAELNLEDTQRRLAQVPLFQLKGLAATPDGIREKFVDQLVELELWVQGARAEKLDELPEVNDRIRDKLLSALIDDLAHESTAAGDVSEEQIAAYYAANKARYEPQLRIKIWIISVASKDEAEKLIATIHSGTEFKDDASFVEAWDKLVREHSIDDTTKMHKGNLGFVQPDGSTAHKELNVSKDLFAAAEALKDGEVGATPLEMEGHWVVFARRGHIMTPERTLDLERPNIRSQLAREGVRARRDKLLEKLRAEHLSDVNDKLLDQIVVTDDDISVARRPGALRQGRAADAKGSPLGVPGNMR